MKVANQPRNNYSNKRNKQQTVHLTTSFQNGEHGNVEPFQVTHVMLETLVVKEKFETSKYEENIQKVNFLSKSLKEREKRVVFFSLNKDDSTLVFLRKYLIYERKRLKNTERKLFILSKLLNQYKSSKENLEQRRKSESTEVFAHDKLLSLQEKTKQQRRFSLPSSWYQNYNFKFETKHNSTIIKTTSYLKKSNSQLQKCLKIKERNVKKNCSMNNFMSSSLKRIMNNRNTQFVGKRSPKANDVRQFTAKRVGSRAA